jgi:ribosomal-protein-alanine N-acetyltransferase
VPLATRNFQLRDFQPPDFDSLWTIDQSCFPPGISYSRTELKTYIRRRGAFTLVAIGPAGEVTVPNNSRMDKKAPSLSSSSPIPQTDDIAGFIVAEAARGAGHVITIDVVASARRFGIGSLLLRGAEDRLRAAACRSVELETAVDNLSALSFYKRHAYHVIQTFPRYYSNGVDALVLQKDLAA